MTIVLPRSIQPTWQSGFARSDGESAHPDRWRGLVGAWVAALGPSGQALYDLARFQHDGALTNMDPGTDWVPGELGYALDFDGSNDVVNTSKTIDKYMASTDGLTMLTISKGTSAGTGAGSGFGWLADSPQRGAMLGPDDGDRIFFSIPSTSTTINSVSVTGISIGTEWEQLVGTYQPGDFQRLYRNGDEIASDTTSIPTSLYQGTTSVRIGTRGDAAAPSLFDGLISMVLLYNRALSPWEVRENYTDPYGFLRLADTPVLSAEQAAPAGTILPFIMQYAG